MTPTDLHSRLPKIVPPFLEAFIDANDEQTTFLPAPEIARMGAHLIATCPELGHLVTASIDYAWKRTGGKTNGMAKLAGCDKTSPYTTYRTGYQFVIWLAADHCRAILTTQQQFEAVIFDHLMRADIDPETSKPTTRHPDVVTFTATVERYGAFTSELSRARDVFVQAPLVPGIDLVPFTTEAA